jgi:hypothetical protein
MWSAFEKAALQLGLYVPCDFHNLAAVVDWNQQKHFTLVDGITTETYRAYVLLWLVKIVSDSRTHDELNSYLAVLLTALQAVYKADDAQVVYRYLFLTRFQPSKAGSYTKIARYADGGPEAALNVHGIRFWTTFAYFALGS